MVGSLACPTSATVSSRWLPSGARGWADTAWGSRQPSQLSTTDAARRAGRHRDQIKALTWSEWFPYVADVVDLGQAMGASMATFELLPEADHAALVLVMLGGFRLVWGMSVVSVPRASQRLLVFLALHGEIVKRAAVAGALWPDVSEHRAYSNLRAALARLGCTARTALATSKLELGLAEGVTVDIRRAQALARRLLDSAVPPDPSELGMTAVAALSADLLPDWYDDWVLVEAEDWRQLRLHALDALAGQLTAAGRWGEAAGAARAAVRAEPLRESAHAALIRVHLAEGNQSEALREYASYRALLHAELGLEPTPRLRQLVQGLCSS
jgi:SARP family transcriptional regulator, regulator of embCAB operon